MWTENTEIGNKTSKQRIYILKTTVYPQC